MKKIEAVVKPFKFDEIIEALKKENIRRVTVFEVKGVALSKDRSSNIEAPDTLKIPHETY